MGSLGHGASSSLNSKWATRGVKKTSLTGTGCQPKPPNIYILADMTPSPSDSALRATLIDLVATKALKRGTFRLASGREASFYLDAKQVILDAQGWSAGPFCNFCSPLAACRRRWGACRLAPIRSPAPW